jgi:hypothetical protein
MAYVITGINDTAAHMFHGVRSHSAQVDVQASLADIDWMQGGSYAVDNALNVYVKDPSTGHWVLPAATPILITRQPVGLTVVEGDITETVSLACYAQDSTAEYTPTYAWYNCEDDGSNPSAVANATSATLTIPNDLQNASAPYYYYCTITANGQTLNSSIITVEVDAAPAP